MKATIDITKQCNLRCKHCFNSDKYFNNHSTEISDLKIIELVNRLAEFQCDSISLLGGEPFMRKNLIDFLNLAKEKNITVNVTTNGILLNDKKYEIIFKENLISTLMFSIDGYDSDSNDLVRGKGSFNKLMNNLDIVNKWRKEYNSNIIFYFSHCLIDKYINLNSTKIIDICKEKKIDVLSVFPIINSGMAAKDESYLVKSVSKRHEYIENLIKYAEKENQDLIFSIEERPIVSEYYNIKYKVFSICSEYHSKCNVFNDTIYIKADGTILPCGFVEFEKGFEEQRNGKFHSSDTTNILDISKFSDIYNLKLFKDFIRNYNIYENEIDRSLCSDCRYSQSCQPCAYQDKNREIICECEEIYPKLIELIGLTKKWKVRKIFNIPSINKLFNHNINFEMYEGFKKSEGFNTYRDFLNYIVLLEKKKLVEIIRSVL
jgi:MoaA/NifB/PqqE/SkfB family radical SAM enzyme